MKLKKLAAILLVAVMLFGLSATALADAVITISPVDATNSFEFYKLFTAENVTAGGTTVTKYAFVPAAKAAIIAAINAVAGSDVTTGKTDTEIMMYLSAVDGAFARALAVELEKNKANLGTPATPDETLPEYDNNRVTFTFDDGNGYYLILDAKDYGTNPPAAQFPMLTTANEASAITLKTTPFTPPGKVITGIVNNIFDHAGNSVSIGDTVNFQITVDIPDYILYVDYSFKVYDIMDAGYDFNATTVAASIGSTNYTPTVTTLTGTDRADIVAAMALDGIVVADDKAIIEFDFGNINTTFAGVATGSSLVITYTATVNRNAAPINNNSAVVLQNGTYVTGNGTSTDTYGFKINKANEYGEELNGVKFFLMDTATITPSTRYFTFAKGADGIYRYTGIATAPPTYDSATKVWTVDSNLSLVTADFGVDPNVEHGVINAFGLGAGTYYLYEYETLAGYNLLASAKQIVLAAADGDTTNVVTYDVINLTGIELPGTGGIGTMLFTFFGCAIILGGVVFLAVNRKRVFGK